MSKILTQASTEWAKRPDDERYLNLPDMEDRFLAVRANSRALVVPNRRLEVVPDEDHRGLSIRGPNGHGYRATHWSFGQLAQLAGAPAGYLRKLPAELVADNMNYGLQVGRSVEETGVLLTVQEDPVLRAATGPNYGRVWNADVVRQLIDRFGDGVTGDWRVPGEFGEAVEITKRNTTLFASDRDMFVFLADEDNKIEVPGAGRNGENDLFSRGFFVWNSEVGAATLGIATFLFRYACCNRIVWGVEQHKEVRIRHTSGAPDRWMEQVVPALEDYSRSSQAPVVQAITDARGKKLDADKLDSFLANRFGKSLVANLKATHLEEEGRPIETVWDAVNAATAIARSNPHQDDRVALERQAGELLN